MQTCDDAYEKAKANIPPHVLAAYRNIAKYTAMEVLERLAKLADKSTSAMVTDSVDIISAALMGYFMHGHEAANGRIPGHKSEL